MSPCEEVFNQNPRKPTQVKLGTTTDELGNCNPSDTSICKTHLTHTHLEQQFNHPKLAKLRKGTFAKLFLDKEKQFNETYQTITRILQNCKKLTDEMNTRFRIAKPLPIRIFVLLTNQQQIEGVSKKLIPLKTGPYLIIEKPTDTTYILQDKNKEKITIHRNRIVRYYPKEKHIKEKLNNYLFDKNVPTLKQPEKPTIKKNCMDLTPETEKLEENPAYNFRKRKVKLNSK